MTDTPQPFQGRTEETDGLPPTAFESVYWVAYGMGHVGGYIDREDAEKVVAANRAIDLPSELYVWANDYDDLLKERDTLTTQLREMREALALAHGNGIVGHYRILPDLCPGCALLVKAGYTVRQGTEYGKAWESPRALKEEQHERTD